MQHLAAAVANWTWCRAIYGHAAKELVVGYAEVGILPRLAVE